MTLEIPQPYLWSLNFVAQDSQHPFPQGPLKNGVLPPLSNMSSW